jgi:hypothetical protein
MTEEVNIDELATRLAGSDAFEPECLDRHKGGCRGKVEYHLMPDRQDFKTFPRCEAHFERRLAEAERTLELLSDTRPSWFDEANVGERWEED